MRRKLFLYFLGLGLLTAYLVSPLVTAWKLREAIHNGNSDYLAAKVDWPRVKQTLKTSMTSYALGQRPDGAAAFDAPDPPKPSLWQRIKAAYGRNVVASMVDTMVTPEGLPKLLAYRRDYNETFRSIPDEAKSLSWPERLRRTWARVVKAEFLTPTTFAMRDKVIAHRSYLGHLELQGGTWKLVHLEVKGQRPQGRISRAWSAVKQAALP